MVGPAQTREDIFEFTQKLEVKKQGEGYTISFASKGKCDATVAILDKDGNVIRHLASGVLGANAPKPFKKNALSQNLVWNGLDDSGKKAPAGCSVKVGLGLKFAPERDIAYHPAGIPEGKKSSALKGAACGPDGMLYIFATGQIKAFKPDGQYSHTVLPCSASLPPEKMTGFRLLKTIYGDSVIDAGWKGPLENFSFSGDPAISPDGQHILVASPGEGRRIFLLKIGTDGSFLKGAKVVISKAPSAMVFGPSGKTVYFAFSGGIYKKAFSEINGPEKISRKNPAMTFDMLIKKELCGEVKSMVCDGNGNIFVADAAGKIHAFKPDGALIKTIDLPGNPVPEKIRSGYMNNQPVALGIAKDGMLYCVIQNRENKWRPLKTKLIKLGGLNDPSIKLEMALSAAGKIAISNAAGKTVVWIVSESGIRQFMDEGDRLKQVVEIKPPEGFVPISLPDGGGYRLVMDLKREELYASWIGRRVGGHWHRFNGVTGERDTSFKDFGATDLALGPDDLIYVRVGFYGKEIVRFDRDFKMVPFLKGKPLKQTRVSKWIRTGNGNCIPIGGGGSNVWTSGFRIAANGDIWTCLHEANFHDKTWSARNAPWAGKRGEYIAVYKPDGSLKHIDAVVNTGATTGIRLDGEGNLYVVEPHPVKPEYGTKKWPGLVKGQVPKDFRAWGKGPGTLLKFAARKDGKLPIGQMSEDRKHKGMLWHYDGMSGVTGHSCGCAQARWDLDGFGRSYIPFMQLYSIMIADANGNTIMRLGRWGNVDSSKTGDIGLIQVRGIAASDRALYIADEGNLRILKATMLYHVEQELTLQ